MFIVSVFLVCQSQFPACNTQREIMSYNAMQGDAAICYSTMLKLITVCPQAIRHQAQGMTCSASRVHHLIMHHSVVQLIILPALHLHLQVISSSLGWEIERKAIQ